MKSGHCHFGSVPCHRNLHMYECRLLGRNAARLFGAECQLSVQAHLLSTLVDGKNQENQNKHSLHWCGKILAHVSPKQNRARHCSSHHYIRSRRAEGAHVAIPSHNNALCGKDTAAPLSSTLFGADPCATRILALCQLRMR